ncbi:MAG: helix-turn-helix domain-containing protein [Muribaculaceae bacterium]|nr:helix-turn-helix domain-containing protein [Muribaculaceae bacterium]
MSSTIGINKICEWCGKEFIAHKCTTCYCSKRCSEHAYKSLRREAHAKKENLITQEKKEDKKKPLGNYFTPRQCAVLLGIGKSSVYRCLAEGLIPCIRLKGKTLISRASIDKMFENPPEYIKRENIGANITSLLDTVITRKNANKSRIYLLGTSFGAQGGWCILSQYPDLFAVAQLASAAPKRYTLENVVKTPIYFTLGGNDIDKASKYESDIKSIQDAGGEIVFTILPGLNHQQACDAAYTPESVSWLTKHKNK